MTPSRKNNRQPTAEQEDPANSDEEHGGEIGGEIVPTAGPSTDSTTGLPGFSQEQFNSLTSLLSEALAPIQQQVTQLVNQLAIQSASQQITQLANQLAIQSVTQLVSQLATQPVQQAQHTQLVQQAQQSLKEQWKQEEEPLQQANTENTSKSKQSNDSSDLTIKSLHSVILDQATKQFYGDGPARNAPSITLVSQPAIQQASQPAIRQASQSVYIRFEKNLETTGQG